MSDWGFDVDWSLGQRVDLPRLRREAPRFFAPMSAYTFNSVLRSKFAAPIRDQLIGKSFIVPIYAKEAPSASCPAS